MSVAVSICVPTFELGGRGVLMLSTLFKSAEIQSFRDFEVVVSDHSVGDDVRELCREWSERFTINYVRNERSRGSCEANLNNAVEHARGELIKPLFQDDFLLAPAALDVLVGAITAGKEWSAGGCMHCREDDVDTLFYPHAPRWQHERSLALGANTIGSPSVVLYPRSVQDPLFDENLLWHMDCELYYRLGLEIGGPACVEEHLHVIRLRHDSITDSVITDEQRAEEHSYIERKLDGSQPALDEFPLLRARAQELELRQPMTRRRRRARWPFDTSKRVTSLAARAVRRRG